MLKEQTRKDGDIVGARKKRRKGRGSSKTVKNEMMVIKKGGEGGAGDETATTTTKTATYSIYAVSNSPPSSCRSPWLCGLGVGGGHRGRGLPRPPHLDHGAPMHARVVESCAPLGSSPLAIFLCINRVESNRISLSYLCF